MAFLPTLYFHMLPVSCFIGDIMMRVNVKNRYQGILEICISRVYSSSVQFFVNGIAKTKLATLPFLYCGTFVKKTLVCDNSHRESCDFCGRKSLIVQENCGTLLIFFRGLVSSREFRPFYICDVVLLNSQHHHSSFPK